MSDPTALVAELRLALTRDQYCDGTTISHSVASGLLALIAQQAAELAEARALGTQIALELGEQREATAFADENRTFQIKRAEKAIARAEKAEREGEGRMSELRPITRDECDAFIREHHRHHRPPVGALWRHAVHDDDGRLTGVAVVGRPVARALDDGLTCEVTRLCTDGSRNACSQLYAAARKAALAKGFRRGLTYILASEDGASVRAAGWDFLWSVEGRSWDCASRPRTDKHPTEDKQAYGWGAWPELKEHRP